MIDLIPTFKLHKYFNTTSLFQDLLWGDSFTEIISIEPAKGIPLSVV